MKTFDDFIAWLEKQPKDRRFRNGSGCMCVGHAFLVESCGRTEAHHSLPEVDETLPGFYSFFASKLNVLTDDQETAGMICGLAKQFKSEQNLL